MEANVTLPDTEKRGLENAAVIDLMTQEAGTGVVMLVMAEHRPWSGEEEQLFQLQEKINAYLSFALDGEMLELYPHLEGKPLRLRLDSLYPLSGEAHHLVQMVQQQIGFQGIDFQVFVPDDQAEQGGCGCGHGGCGSH